MFISATEDYQNWPMCINIKMKNNVGYFYWLIVGKY